jgi:hypothetical protein
MNKITFRPSEVGSLDLAVLVGTERLLHPPGDAPLLPDLYGFAALRRKIQNAHFCVDNLQRPYTREVKLSAMECALLLPFYTEAEMGKGNFILNVWTRLNEAGSRMQINAQHINTYTSKPRIDAGTSTGSVSDESLLGAAQETETLMP